MQIVFAGGFWRFGTSGAEDCACRWMFWEDSWLRTSLALTGLEAGFAGGLGARDSGSLMGLQVSTNFGRGLPFTPGSCKV